jgi:hypothetical protein
MEMSRKKLKRIFVVEQSASGVGGHHLEYALRIAENSGFDEKNIIVSRKFDLKNVFEGVQIHPIYKYGYWDLPGKELIKFLQKTARRNKSSIHSSLKVPNFLIKRYYLFSTFRQPDVFLSIFSKKSIWPPKISISNLFIFTVLGILLLPLIATLIVLKIIRRLINLEINKRVYFKAIKSFKGLIYYILKVVTLLSLRLKYIQFARDTVRIFNQNLLNDSDLLFFGTISQNELSALNQVLSVQENKPNCVVILRREPNENGDRAWNWQKISKLSQANSINFFADTRELASTYSDLFGFKVEVFPIPAGYLEPNSEISTKKYEISYLGDARSEKGFESFSSLISQVPELSAFTQMNHAPEVDSNLALAIHSISRSNSEMTLEPMVSAKYLKTISSSELLWIGYLGVNYEKRSSGIFVEGTVRGIPSLVTDGSWMHAEIYRNSIKYWNESLRFTDAEIGELRRGIIKISHFPLQKVSLEFILSTGISLVSTGWSDSTGFTYIALPLLHKSESFERINYLHSNAELKVLGFAELDNQPLWVGGLVLNSPDRAHLALKEFLNLKPLYAQFTSSISEYVEFHSASKIKSILEEVTK